MQQKIVNLLHFYQPYSQQNDILDRIVNESYRPLVQGLLERPDKKIVINISAVLTKLLLDRGYVDLINGFRKLLEIGNVEFTGTAMYHAFLPLLPEYEITRQIEENTKLNKNLLGEAFNPTGFFSPEMAINDKVSTIIEQLGYKWLPVAYIDPLLVSSTNDRLLKMHKHDLFVFLRNKRISTLMLSGMSHSCKDFIYETTDMHNEKEFWFTVMDAETYGHHRIGHEKFLFEVLDETFFKTQTINEILKSYDKVEEVEVRPSTWTNEEQDFWLDKEKTQSTDAKSFILWHDPTNPVHALQWDLTNLVINEVHNYANKNSDNWVKARTQLDKALASDQYWWASAKPWWSLEMIELGAYELRDVVKTLDSDEKIKLEAEMYYRKILDQAFEWQRTGYIRRKHLDNSATFMKQPFKDRTNPEWYNQIILEFEDEMNKSAERRDFEQCVKWRDALLKLKLGTDPHDVLHVVDELWSARKIPSVKPFLLHTWEEFSEFAKKNFLNVDSKEAFEAWQKTEVEKIETLKKQYSQ